MHHSLTYWLGAMDDLLSEFIAETHEMLAAVQEALVAWEADPSDREKLDVIFRFVHTVKGNCGFFDLPRLAQLSHVAESTLADLRSGERQPDKALIDAILAVVDRIDEMVSALGRGEDLPDGSDADLIAAMQAEKPSKADAKQTKAVASAPRAQAPDNASPPMPAAARSIRLPVTLLDRVMAEISDAVLIRNELARHVRDQDLDPAIAATFDRLSNTINELREDISQMRMHRLEHLYTTLPRLVRDLANELGKKVTLEMEGGEVELDREIIELIRDPIVHILRNALDHGIEAPEDRVKAGKPENGFITIATRQTGNRVRITIDDDGKGIDADRLVERAIGAGIIEKSDVSRMSHADKLSLIFEPGISTAQQVTSVSGRGVGMDVVRTNIHQLGGTIDLTSDNGEGACIHISLPATLSIVPSLTVRVGDHRFGVPRSYAEEIVSARSDELTFSKTGDSTLVEFRGKRLRCIRLADALEIPGHPIEQSDLMVVKLTGGDLCAIAVDKVLDHEDLAVKPLAEAIMSSNLYTGASLLDDGSLVLMLHVTGIALQQGLISETVRRKRVYAVQDNQEAEAKIAIPAVLLGTAKGDRRLVRMDSVTRLAKVESEAVRLGGTTAQVVLDGKILPLAGANVDEIDDEKATILILGDGEHEIGYLISRVIDTVTITDELMPSEEQGEVEGLVLLEGRATEVLDCHWLFARHAKSDLTKTDRTCVLDLGDQWTRAILRPLVESAGYRVLDGAENHDEADVAIVTAGSPEPEVRAGRVIKLSSDGGQSDDADGTVHRYDREALLEALANRKQVSA
ncbi:chemotaxis protein CheA [Aurantiacibacter sediminis]|uniref:histidine kinase n=1 Tax=Aurantiacibacter sediminis TaxID=2793064 RepID=A0ABS0N5U4_9SPHN|nr:chemotaxis protein CheW [Aurantiacibacter sediminis]MBH5323179.1 chemotaxis protein CheW [Aurantiacibacter sediminis]